MDKLDSIINDLLLAQKSKISMAKTVFNSGYVGMLMPIDCFKVLPGDEINYQAHYDTTLARCTGIVANNMVVDFFHVYVPTTQVHKNYEEKLWEADGQGSYLPTRTIDLNDITSDTDALFYMLPKTTVGDGNNVLIDMRTVRMYQKIWFDLFSQGYTKLVGGTVPSDFYSTDDGTDSTTTTTLRAMPINNQYIDQLIASITSSGTISAPFTIETLQKAIIAERTHYLKKKYSGKPRDLIKKLFRAKGERTDSVKLIAHHRYMMNEMQVLSTSETDTGKAVSRFVGYNNNNEVKYEVPAEFGYVMVLACVRPTDCCLSSNLPLIMDANYQNDAFADLRPEAQGLAYKQLYVKHFDLNQENATVTAIGAEQLWDHMRYPMNQAKGHYSRSDSLEKQIVALKGNSLLDFTYFNTTHFTDLFAENPQVRFKVTYTGNIDRVIKTNIEISTL